MDSELREIGAILDGFGAEDVTLHCVMHADGKPVVSLGAASARALVGRVSEERMMALADAAREYLPAVQAELATRARAVAANPRRFTIRAILFGISTPRRSEDQSIAYAIAAEPLWDALSAEDMARVRYPSPTHGGSIRLGTPLAIERAISDARALLGPFLWEMRPEYLQAVRGIGPKVARMIQAVCHPDARGFTVDVWHARQALWLADMPYDVDITLRDEGYPILEALWLDYCDRYFPGLPYFAVQWATWCAAQGQFFSHAALWADLAE